MADYLPEHVLVKILERLSIKSLIRFTCVSKHWKFIILSDPQLAKSQYQIASQQQTLSRRLIVSSYFKYELDSLDVNMPSSLRELRCPFKQRGRGVKILCSCNGLFLAAVNLRENDLYIWNPVTGFFKHLPSPDPFAVPGENYKRNYYGFGYLSATDDYKLLTRSVDDDDGEKGAKKEKNEIAVHIFSSKANIWKRIKSPFSDNSPGPAKLGTLSNEALHWLNNISDTDPQILVFDLANEEFRTMLLPDDDDAMLFSHIRVFGGCLCVFGLLEANAGSIDVWVMREYGVADSWTKLFDLKVSTQLENIMYLKPVIIMETCTFLQKGTLPSDGGMEFRLIRCAHEEEKLETYVVSDKYIDDVVAYEETLLGLAAC